MDGLGNSRLRIDDTGQGSVGGQMVSRRGLVLFDFGFG